MSESSNSNGGESPSRSYSGKYSSNNSESKVNANESSYESPTYPHESSSSKPNLEQVKRFLKETEDFVGSRLTASQSDSVKLMEEFTASRLPSTQADKQKFIARFRDIVMENEQELLAHPNTTFFIAKFEADTLLPKDLKEAIVSILYEKSNLDKQKKSQLKYW